MPLTVSHALSATTPDDPQYEIRPSHWNSAHVVTLNASGSEISGAFSNAGNVTFGLETNGFITASANAAGAGDGFNRIAAGTQTAGTNNTIVFANSNGVTFGMSGSTQITASHNGITQQSTQPVAFNAGAVSSAFSTLVFQDSNGVSWSNSNGSVVASVATNYLTTAAQSNQVVNSLNGSTGQISLNVGSSLSASTNGSSITFGLASNITTALQSAGAYLTTARASNDAVGLNSAVSNVTATINSSGLSLDARGYAGTNVTTAGANIGLSATLNSNGLNLSATVPAGGGGAAISAAGGSQSTGTIVFSNSNGISFGFNAGTITATVNPGAAAGIAAIQVSDATYTSGTAIFTNANGISFGSSAGGGVQVTHALQFTSNTSAITSNALHSSASRVSGIVAATNSTGGGTATLTGGVSFSNANGVSFYTSAGNAVVASIAQLSAGVTNAGNTSGDIGFVTGQFNLQGGNNITLSGSTNGGSMSVTVSAPNYAVSNSAGSFTFRTLNFSNANNVTWGTSAGGIVTASVNAGGGGAAISGGANSQNTGTVNFANSNGITFGLSNNGTLTASHNGLTTAAQSDHSHGNPTLALTNLSGTTASNSAGFTLSLSAGAGGASPAASASNGSFTFQTLGFSNANNVTFGTSAGSIITASVAAPGAAAENNWVNLLGANTAGNTTASGSTIGYSGINLTLSGTNGSVVNISAPATSSLVGVSGITLSSNGSTVSVYHAPIPVHGWGNYSDGEHLTVVNGQNTILFQPMFVPAHIAFSEVVFPINYTNASNSSNSCTLTMHVGIYTRNASSLSLFTSTSSSYATTNSGTAGNMSLWLGKRNVPIGFTSSITPGQYWLALRSQTTTGGGAGMSFSNYHFSNQNTVLSGSLGVGNNASNAFMPGMGSYSATSTAMPGSVAFTEIRGSAAANLRGIAYYFGGANV